MALTLKTIQIEGTEACVLLGLLVSLFWRKDYLICAIDNWFQTQKARKYKSFSKVSRKICLIFA